MKTKMLSKLKYGIKKRNINHYVFYNLVLIFTISIYAVLLVNCACASEIIIDTIPEVLEITKIKTQDPKIDKYIDSNNYKPAGDCLCKEYIYLNEPHEQSILKFEIDPNAISLTEVLGANGGTLGTELLWNAQHQIAVKLVFRQMAINS